MVHWEPEEMRETEEVDTLGIKNITAYTNLMFITWLLLPMPCHTGRNLVKRDIPLVTILQALHVLIGMAPAYDKQTIQYEWYSKHHDLTASVSFTEISAQCSSTPLVPD